MNENTPPREAAKRYITHAKAAEIRGVSGRTLDRWIEAGLMARPETINRRKYHEIDNVLGAGHFAERTA